MSKLHICTLSKDKDVISPLHNYMMDKMMDKNWSGCSIVHEAYRDVTINSNEVNVQGAVKAFLPPPKPDFGFY